jgi:hypothetical protein
MSIPFTQFLMPTGRPKRIEIDRPLATEILAAQLIADGYRFECEILSTGQVSLTCEDDDDETLAIEVCSNGPDVPLAVDRLVSAASEARAK